MQIIRYRIYQVIKWLFAGFSLVTIALVYTLGGETKENWGNDMTSGAVLMGIVWGVLAIFFKLQEDSNKPTVEE